MDSRVVLVARSIGLHIFAYSGRVSHRTWNWKWTGCGLGSMIELVRCYAGRNTDMTPWLADAVVNTDRNLRLQYLAGWALNARGASEIRDSFRPYAKYPEGLLIGKSLSVAALSFILKKSRNGRIESRSKRSRRWLAHLATSCMQFL